MMGIWARTAGVLQFPTSNLLLNPSHRHPQGSTNSRPDVPVPVVFTVVSYTTPTAPTGTTSPRPPILQFLFRPTLYQCIRIVNCISRETPAPTFLWQRRSLSPPIPPPHKHPHWNHVTSTTHPPLVEHPTVWVIVGVVLLLVTTHSTTLVMSSSNGRSSPPKWPG